MHEKVAVFFLFIWKTTIRFSVDKKKMKYYVWEFSCMMMEVSVSIIQLRSCSFTLEKQRVADDIEGEVCLNVDVEVETVLNWGCAVLMWCCEQLNSWIATPRSWNDQKMSLGWTDTSISGRSSCTSFEKKSLHLQKPKKHFYTV